MTPKDDPMAKRKTETKPLPGSGSGSRSKALEIRRVPVSSLLLDPENPRLETVDLEGDSQTQLVKALWSRMAVEELALSIAANGFFAEEPLFVIAEQKHGAGAVGGSPRYVVVEGNRRLAAVRLLTDSALREKVRATDLPTITPERAEELRTLPVSVYPDRRSLWEYFGFRHVNGPKQWDSYSKAAYVARVKREYGISLKEIAYRIGDRHRTVERLYRGFVLLEQAEKSTVFDPEDRYRKRLAISHLYTAVEYAEVAEFLGINPDAPPEDDPVPKKRLPHLRELMLWLYGSRIEGREPLVQSQNPDLRRLCEAIGNPEALVALRSGATLARANAIGRGDSQRFEEALVVAKDALQDARGTVTTGYRGAPAPLERIEEILRIARKIEREMKEIRDSSDDEPERKETRRGRALSR